MCTKKSRSFGSWVAALIIAAATVSFTQIAAAPWAAATAAHTRTSTTVTLNNNNRTFDVGTIAISGNFINARNHHGVGSASIQIWSHALSGGSWVHIANARTNSAGRFSVNVNATTSRLYQARFAGTGSLAPSTARNARINVVRVATRIASQSVSRSSVSYGGGVDIRGVVIDARNHRVTGQRVELWSVLPGSPTWTHIANTTTSSAGTYVLSTRSLTRTINYQVRFPATVKWVAAAAPVVRVNVGKSSTTLTVGLLHATVGSGATEVVSGSVSDALHRRVPNQRVEIWSLNAGASSWAHLGSAYTNSSGAYAFATRPLSASTSFQTRYAGSAFMSATGSAVVKATVASASAPKPPVTAPPTSNPPAPVGWSSNPELAQDTFSAVNRYRVSQGLQALLITAPEGDLDNCVKSNTVGKQCDPGNLASGYLTGTAVVNAWIASPEHKSNMLVPQWNHMVCAAYTHSDGVSADVGCEFDF